MATFILQMDWTAEGIKKAKDVPKRLKASRELGKKLGVEIKQIFLTSGQHDLLVIAEAANGDNFAKFAITLGGQGNVRTQTSRAWPEAEFLKLISELP